MGSLSTGGLCFLQHQFLPIRIACSSVRICIIPECVWPAVIAEQNKCSDYRRFLPPQLLHPGYASAFSICSIFNILKVDSFNNGYIRPVMSSANSILLFTFASKLLSFVRQAYFGIVTLAMQCESSTVSFETRSLRVPNQMHSLLS